MNSQLPSRFLDEIPSTLLRHEDCSYWTDYQVSSLLKSFSGNNSFVENPVKTFGSSAAIKPAVKVGSKLNSEKQQNNSTWKINQPAKHSVFGIGIIQNIEQKGSTTFLTLRFKIGVKKVSADFIQKI